MIFDVMYTHTKAIFKVNSKSQIQLDKKKYIVNMPITVKKSEKVY